MELHPQIYTQAHGNPHFLISFYVPLLQYYFMGHKDKLSYLKCSYTVYSVNSSVTSHEQLLKYCMYSYLLHFSCKPSLQVAGWQIHCKDRVSQSR